LKNLLEKNWIDVYTDGGCDPNPGPGGWAAIIIKNGLQTEISGFEANTTNNRMELTAALKALNQIPSHEAIHFFTDSRYLQRGVEEWLDEWKKRGWKRKGGALANIDLWQAMEKSIEGRQIKWKWIKGHADNPFNQKVDRLVHIARAKIKDR
jgi:ribonuclease HI